MINDLSGFGKCSLTAAISAIAAMGVQPCPLPTAVLSAQTGYSSYYCDDYTDRMELIYKEWDKMQVHFDGIYTGFMSGEHQIRKVLEFLDIFYKKDTFLLVDPVMGDNGNRYPIFTSELVAEMKSLVSRADIITPNLTELCLLTDTDYRMIKVMTEEKHLVTVAEQMARKSDDGRNKRSTCHRNTFYRRREQTGDDGKSGGDKRRRFIFRLSVYWRELFGDRRSVCFGDRRWKSKRRQLTDTMKLAGEMIERAIRTSVKNHVPRNDGVDYEQYLWMLGEKNRLKQE